MKDMDSKRWTRVPASSARTVGLCALVCAGLLVVVSTHLIVSQGYRYEVVYLLILAACLVAIGVAVDRKRYDDDPPKKDAQKRESSSGEGKEAGKEED